MDDNNRHGKLFYTWQFFGIVNLTIDGQIAPAKPSCLCAHRFLPDLKGLGAQQTVMNRLHEVAAET